MVSSQQPSPQADLPLHDVATAAAHGDETFVHPTAVVAKGASFGKGVYIGPYCVIGGKTVLRDHVRLESHVSVQGRTDVGARTVIHPFATLGVMPQDMKYAGEDSELIIGEENSIRSYANLSLGTEGGGGKTIIGRHNLLMSNVHVGHDSIIGTNCILATGATLGGHVEVGDHAVLGGASAVHQFCKVGLRTMAAGGSMITQDVPPFCMVQGDRARPNGLNVVGLRRAGYTAEDLRDLKSMYRLVYSENLTIEDAIARIEAELADSPHRQVFVGFLRSSKRGIVR